MRILITGSTGQLGSEWIAYLTGEGQDVHGYASTELDITDAARVRALLDREKPDLVINCAAFTDVDGAEDQREEAFAVNRDGVANLADWCFRNDVKLIHFSTDYVFPGRPGDRTTYPLGYPEDAPKAPINVYGVSKLAGEQALVESGAEFLIVRTSWLCGPSGNNFIKTMLRLGRERKELSVVNDQHGSPSFTKNVVLNTFNLIQTGKTGIWHITSGGLITWYDLARQIFELAGIDVDLKAVPSTEFIRRAERPSFSKLNTGKLEEVEGSDVEDWKTGLKKLLSELQFL